MTAHITRIEASISIPSGNGTVTSPPTLATASSEVITATFEAAALLGRSIESDGVSMRTEQDHSTPGNTLLLAEANLEAIPTPEPEPSTDPDTEPEPDTDPQP